MPESLKYLGVIVIAISFSIMSPSVVRAEEKENKCYFIYNDYIKDKIVLPLLRKQYKGDLEDAGLLNLDAPGIERAEKSVKLTFQVSDMESYLDPPIFIVRLSSCDHSVISYYDGRTVTGNSEAEKKGYVPGRRVQLPHN